MSIVRTYLLLLALLPGSLYAVEKAVDRDFHRSVRFHIRNHCSSCHNQTTSKGGVNLDVFDFASSVARRGELFRKVIQTVEEGSMPPSGQPRMKSADRDTMVAGINRILDRVLATKDPGPGIMRRLSHSEYTYTIKDLVGVDFNAYSYFPTDASGGEGFDNQSRVLYMTPLLWERYYDAADSIIGQVHHTPELWQQISEQTYRPGVWQKVKNWWSSKRSQQIELWNKPRRLAQAAILPFAQKAYRRFLTSEEEVELITFFEDIYLDLWQEKDGYDQALQVVLKKILISPSFLFRMEVNQPTKKPHQVNNFELASRMSYLLWSSMPDDTLLNTAYRENLHDSLILRRETLRMMSNPKFKRFAATFAPQWLGTQDLIVSNPADPTLFPEFTPSLREALHQEVIGYFDYVFDQGNLLQLLNSNFALLNEELASFYEIEGVRGDDMRLVDLASKDRGGVLGMGAVLAATSLPNRTSPVLRGQWVLEKIMGTRVPPPPPDVPDLAEAKSEVRDELDLRSLLEFHREPSACQSCHQKMDPIGFGLENFDAIGRWRNEYREGITIDASGTLADTTTFVGPGELKEILLRDKEKFAENFVRKVLSYALGRGLQFLDSRTIDQLSAQLIHNDFDGPELMINLINSYPFRHRRSDVVGLYLEDV